MRILFKKMLFPICFNKILALAESFVWQTCSLLLMMYITASLYNPIHQNKDPTLQCCSWLPYYQQIIFITNSSFVYFYQDYYTCRTLLVVGENQLPDTNNQIPTSNSGGGTGSGYAIVGCWYGIWQGLKSKIPGRPVSCWQ